MLREQLKERYPKEFEVIEKEEKEEKEKRDNLVNIVSENIRSKLEKSLQKKFLIEVGSVIQQFDNAKINSNYKMGNITINVNIFLPGFKKGGPGIVIGSQLDNRNVKFCLIFAKQELQLIKREVENNTYTLYYKFIRPQLVNNENNTKGLKAIIVEGQDKLKENLVNKIRVIRWSRNKKSILVEVIE